MIARRFSCRLFLLGMIALALPRQEITAATQPDSEIELLETTYRVSTSGTAEVTIRQRLRALTANGRTAVSRVQIPFVAAFHDVEIKFVKTIKKDGSIVNGDPASAFDTAPSVDPLAPSYTDLKFKTFLAPNLETGDSVEYEALMHVHKWAKPEAFWFVHALTNSARVLSEVVVLDLPADRHVALYESKTIPGKTELANGRRIERWEAGNPEPVKASAEVGEPLFAVSSILSWDEFGGWVHSLNKEAAAPTPEIRALAAKLTADKSSEQDRIAALYTYVATKVRYVGISFGVGALQPHMASAVLHNAYGDCKDQTALLSALLTAAGFKAYAVLTTPRVGVSVRDVPIPNQFNHEFTAVETKSGLVFLDTSMGPVSPGVMQPGVRGRSALLVGEKSSSLIDIPIGSPVPVRISEDVKGKVTAAGAFEGSVRFEFRGNLEQTVRRAFLDGTDVEKERLLRGLAGAEFRNANVRQISNGDPSDLTQPFRVQCELSDQNFFPLAAASLQMALQGPNVLAAALEQLKKPGKPLPVEAIAVVMSTDLIVDPSFTVTGQTPAHLKTAFGMFDSDSSYYNGHAVITHSFEAKGAVLAPSEWDAFVAFLRSSLTGISRGLTLERRTYPPSSALSPRVRSLQEGVAVGQRPDYYESVKRALLEATRLNPKSPTAWNNLGRAYSALHEYNEAEQAYKRQIEINPQDLYAYNNLGILYRVLKREDEAIELFRKQIAVTPRDRFAHDNLSISLGAKNQWEQARDEAAIAVEITPEDAAKWARLGKAQIKTNRIDEARQSLNRALALPHDAITENNVAYFMAEAGIDLERAWQLVSGTMNSEARLLCEPEALSKEDKCGAQLRRIALMLDTSGWVLFRQGKLADAEPYLLSAYAVNPRAEVEIHVSSLLARARHLDESLKYFAAARSRADFSRFDSSALRSELVKGVGGETQLDSRIKQIQNTVVSPASTARVIALVDGHGKVLDAQSANPSTPASLAGEAKSLTLLPISWPEHSIRSIRTIEFRQDGAKWSLNQSYVGQSSDPVPLP